MKKVTLTFVVSEEAATDAIQEIGCGNMSNAAQILDENCVERDYNVECYQSKVEKLVEMYESLYDAEKDEFLRETGNN